MQIIFFGSAKFAVPSLEVLAKSSHKVLCVVTQPDKKRGRHLVVEGTPVKDAALRLGLKIYQPEKINSLKALKFLQALEADLFIVIAYGVILSQEILDIPKVIPLNIHASFLPKYRGAAPINWALINGEKKTGVTIIKMVKDLDAGGIILQKDTGISDDDTALTLEAKLSHIASGLLIDSLKLIEDNNYKIIAQDDTGASPAPKLKKEDGRINWQSSAQAIYNLVRGCAGWPGAFSYYKGKMLKIYKARVLESQSVSVSGEIVMASKEGIEVSTGKDNLVITELQIEGKRRMGSQEFIAGHKINLGDIFDKK